MEVLIAALIDALIITLIIVETLVLVGILCSLGFFSRYIFLWACDKYNPIIGYILASLVMLLMFFLAIFGILLMATQKLF